MMSWQPYWLLINNEVVENNFLRLLATKVKMLRKDYYITGSTGLNFSWFYFFSYVLQGDGKNWKSGGEMSDPDKEVEKMSFWCP